MQIINIFYIIDNEVFTFQKKTTALRFNKIPFVNNIVKNQNFMT